ncbi:SDR family NAD(P)-dependent oxidoreductase [Lunatibacter salilacus]|uniref:SDR family NAD(P)-dependent oxidoreductase n=1 Tax=Lunatibacter salilacus TaxID=2483804 RepID=UPI00131E7886|nr:SDR family oxidoreductase [Lunatibacter salilacus]
MEDKNIVIIGGSSGIGKEILEALEKLGANTFVYSKSRTDANRFDATKGGDSLYELPEKIHGVVYCPGSITLKPFHRLSVEDFQQDLDINFLGAVRVLQDCFKSLKNSKGASVVLFSTVAAQTGLVFHSSIAGAKGAVESLTRSLAAEWAPLQIRVNAVAPSLTDTPLASSLLSTEDKKEGAKKRHPLGRYGDAKDIAEAALYLLSDKSSWITGQVLHVDGGMSVIR